MALAGWTTAWLPEFSLTCAEASREGGRRAVGVREDVSVLLSARGWLWYGEKQTGRPYGICYSASLHAGKADGGWAAVLLGSSRHPGRGHATLGLAAGSTTMLLLAYPKALHHEPVTEACTM